MNSAWVCLLGLAAFALGYRFYSQRLARVVFALRPDEPVPALSYEDGVDFVPTPRPVLFGHHYASIAGAAPIIGPSIAVVWGWLPAFVWIVCGAIFMGAVHDFGALVLSMRHGGRSVGQISAEVLGPRTRPLFLLVVFFLVTLVIAVFAKSIATLFVQKPGAVIPVNFQIVVAVLLGWACYKRRIGLLVPSLLAFVALYAMVFVGARVPVSLAALVGPAREHLTWVALMLGYSLVASVLPVWLLLQPRDYINSHQLFVGVAALLVGLLIAHPPMSAPALAVPPEDAPSVIPYLFVTVACGAISGFHGLVASGTTSKQLARAPDARMVGYGAMLGEGVVALVATLAVGAGLADWAGHYHSFAVAERGGITAFVEGGATFLAALGLRGGVAEVFVAVMVISFAATTLDTGVRIQRYILAELADVYGVRWLGRPWVSGAVAVTVPFVLYVSGQDSTLWPLFGTTNQLLAGLTLVVVTVWLRQTGRPWGYTAVPLVAIVAVSGLALLGNLGQYLEHKKYLLLGLGSCLLVLEVWIVLEGWRAFRRAAPVKVSEA